MLLCQLPDTRNLRGSREVERKTVSAWERGERHRSAVRFWHLWHPCVAGFGRAPFSHRPVHKNSRLIKSEARATKSHEGTRKKVISSLSHSLHHARRCASHRRIRSIFVLASSSSRCLSLSPRRSAFLVLPPRSRADGWEESEPVLFLLQTAKGLRSLTLTGYTACQPCSLGGAERFCTPSPPPPFCPGSSVRSPSFPRLRETSVSQKLHFQRGENTFRHCVITVKSPK